MKQQFAAELAAGAQVDDVFVISEKALAQKKNGENYLSITFSDKTGDIKGVAWDNVSAAAAAGAVGDFVRVRGGVSDYRGGLQLTVRELSPVDRGSVRRDDFLPATRRNPERMMERLRQTAAEGIQDPDLLALFAAFWSDEDFVDRFKRAPAGKKMHHAYLGGLLEHTLSMTVLIGDIAAHYSGIDTDILLAGTILHDIGKIREFKYDTLIDYSDEGKLLTHIVIGCGMLDEKLRQVPGFPKEKALLLKHMIVSHHGSREFGSPEPPRTLEAVLLNHIDDIDAKMNGLRGFIAKEDPRESWTAYNPMLRRQLFRSGKEGNAPAGEDAPGENGGE
ncbi:3'-5' exoribonuclease YhaM family protein [Desulfococcus sp.]|uniref:3'-5' exoribonuclease YhaM family protein n=1 Tax=Desulfococcus sp. TaxID=2025834 RepID=UPI003593DD73